MGGSNLMHAHLNYLICMCMCTQQKNAIQMITCTAKPLSRNVMNIVKPCHSLPKCTPCFNSQVWRATWMYSCICCKMYHTDIVLIQLASVGLIQVQPIYANLCAQYMH